MGRFLGSYYFISRANYRHLSWLVKSRNSYLHKRDEAAEEEDSRFHETCWRSQFHCNFIDKETESLLFSSHKEVFKRIECNLWFVHIRMGFGIGFGCTEMDVGRWMEECIPDRFLDLSIYLIHKSCWCEKGRIPLNYIFDPYLSAL